MKTKVVNISKLHKWWMHDDHYVYIGRPGKGIPGFFGNPVELERESDRAKCLEEYREYLENRIKEDLDFRDQVKNLYGKTLVCFCHPKACHGDVLAEVAERLHDQQVSLDNWTRRL